MTTYRQSTPADNAELSALHLLAFGEEEGPAIAKLVSELISCNSKPPVLSLVAEENNSVIGHVIFSPVTVTDNNEAKVYIMAPLAIAPNKQGMGIGSTLILQGLNVLSERGIDIVLVLGDPNYYSRTGFHTNHQLAAPYTLEYPEAWMAQELTTGAIANTAGTICCVEPLMAPEHW